LLRDAVALRHESIGADARFEPLGQADARRERRSGRTLTAALMREDAADFDLQQPDVDDVCAVGDVGPVGLDVLLVLRMGGAGAEEDDRRHRDDFQRLTSTSSLDAARAPIVIRLSPPRSCTASAAVSRLST